MFTGIVEDMGEVLRLKKEGGNLHLTIQSSISSEMSVDQSVSHNGVCLTVVDQIGGKHIVTAVEETLRLTNIGALNVGDRVNLERSVKLNDRLDGHIVQGHVDTTGKCCRIKEEAGSWVFTIDFDKQYAPLVISKGSICVNGVSLTVIHPGLDQFSVAIIPYTYHATIFHRIRLGDLLNLEFDVIGKYLNRRMQLGQIV